MAGPASGGFARLAVTALRARDLLVLYPESSWREARWDSAQVPLILGAAAWRSWRRRPPGSAHRISGRIHRLEHQVARIAEGDFRDLEPGRHDDEIHDLARSINLMCAQLQQMSQTIRQAERTSLLAQLAAGMAHQLRNARHRCSYEHSASCQAVRARPG